MWLDFDLSCVSCSIEAKPTAKIISGQWDSFASSWCLLFFEFPLPLRHILSHDPVKLLSRLHAQDESREHQEKRNLTSWGKRERHDVKGEIPDRFLMSKWLSGWYRVDAGSVKETNQVLIYLWNRQFPFKRTITSLPLAWKYADPHTLEQKQILRMKCYGHDDLTSFFFASLSLS